MRKPIIIPVGAGRLTPQQALVAKNEQLGNTHIKNMQGTSRSLYHFLPIDGRETYNFFKELNKFAFPFTNLDQNKLNAGETMSLQRAYFVVMACSAGTTTPTGINAPESAAATKSVTTGVFNVVNGNQSITKDIFAGSFQSTFNRGSKFGGQSVYHFDTMASLLENVEFYATLRVKGLAAIADSYLGLVIEGVGSILNLKQNS